MKEHHRKKRKEAKKLGIKPKEPKDPGIPKQWPFKEELIAQLMAQKERALLKERMLRDQRRAQAAAAMEVGDGGEDGGEQQQQQGQQLAALRAAATNRGKEYDRTAAGPAAGPTAFVDSSRRAFYKEFVKVAESSDVIIEVLDARDPQGCRCLEVERFVRKLDPSKKIVLLLNKIGGWVWVWCWPAGPLATELPGIGWLWGSAACVHRVGQRGLQGGGRRSSDHTTASASLSHCATHFHSLSSPTPFP